MVAIDSPATGSADARRAPAGWRLDRVSFAAQDPPRTLEFHPGLNIVLTAPNEVAAHLARLRAVLQGGDGTHVEFTVVDGPSLVVFRPFGARHRLIELESGEERPLAALASFTLDDATADVAALHAEADVVRHLSRFDQATLWGLAEQVLVERHGGVTAEVAPIGTGPTAGVPTDPSGPGTRKGLFRRKAGKTSVAATAASTAPQTAEQAWWQLAGPVDVDTALCHRGRVEAAAGLQGRLGAMAAVGAEDNGGWQAVDPVEIVRAVCALVPSSNPRGGPHIAAVPTSIDRELLSFVLDHLAGEANDRQVILVTGDDTIVDWARLESHARRAALLRLDGAPRTRHDPSSN